MAYRLLLERDREEQLMIIQAQVDAGTPYGWVTIGEWTHPAPGRLTTKVRDTLNRQICTEHGWTLISDAPGDGGKDTAVLEVRPIDWHRLLTDATQCRAAHKAAYEAADLAWQTIVADTPRQGEDGYISAIEIAKLAGMTRYRVYQIQGVGKKPGLRPATTPRATED